MGIWDRLGSVIKSYVSNSEWKIHNSNEKVFGKTTYNDPDLDAAFEELDDFLHGSDNKSSSKTKKHEKPVKKPVPEEIKKAFAELGLTPEATARECKEAYKNLLKTHHPDRHTKHEENMKKATDKTSRVNAAYESLMKWFKEIRNEELGMRN